MEVKIFIYYLSIHCVFISYQTNVHIECDYPKVVYSRWLHGDRVEKVDEEMLRTQYHEGVTPYPQAYVICKNRNCDLV